MFSMARPGLFLKFPGIDPIFFEKSGNFGELFLKSPITLPDNF